MVWCRSNTLDLIVFTSLSVFILTDIMEQVKAKELTLTILHTNDVHSRFVQTNKYSNKCSEKEAKENKCYGGFPRLHHKVQEIRSQVPNVVYLNAGDYYQGTVWYTLLKSDVVSRFVNMLNHTAMALGNHEFDDNISGVLPFLRKATFPVLSSNIDASEEPSIQGKFLKSTVVLYEDVKVGIIGYTTTETKDISSPGKLIFNDEITSITEEAKRLHDDGVKILIAVGHAGYDVDMKIAEKVPLIDAVVGGHTNTFLYHGNPPDVEKVIGDYPTIITQPDGRMVPVVQAYAFGKYLGYLNLTFDDNGEMTKWEGNPILLDSSVPQDPDMLAALREIEKNLTQSMKKEIGKTHVFLDGNDCRLKECNLGNLIADAMVYANIKLPGEHYWSDVTMAMLNGGGVRSSIDAKASNGGITIEDIFTVLPFGTEIDVIEIQGKHLKEAFEFSVDGYDPKGYHTAGKFLQVSGIRVVFDLSQPSNSRVRKLEVLCSHCRVPSYVPIDLEQVYKVAVPDYIAKGGDGFQVIKKNIIKRHEPGISDTAMLQKYIMLKSPITLGVEDRIVLYNELAHDAGVGVLKFSIGIYLLPIISVIYLYA